MSSRPLDKSTSAKGHMALTTRSPRRALARRWEHYEVHRLRRLHPQLHPWIQLISLPDGSTEFYDPMLNTRLHLNPTAGALVTAWSASAQTLGELAAELAQRFDRDERQLLNDLIHLYKALESKDAVKLATWRYAVLWLQHIRWTFTQYGAVFYREFFRGIRLLGGG